MTSSYDQKQLACILRQCWTCARPFFMPHGRSICVACSDAAAKAAREAQA